MPRYNSIAQSLTATGTTSFSTPEAGIFTTLTGTSGYTVTLADPTRFTGESQSFYNATGGNVTLATVTGTIIGPGASNASTITVPNNTVYTLTSNGSNYVLSNNEGGAITGTSADISGTTTLTGTTNLNSTVNANPSNANISLAPTGTGSVTINPATAGAINNMSIGASTRGTGAFTTLSANNTTTLVNTTITPTQPASSNIVADGHGLILRAANYTGGNFDHRFVKPDMGGGIPTFVQQTTGTAGTWTNCLRIGTFTGQNDMLYVYGSVQAEGNALFGSTGTAANRTVDVACNDSFAAGFRAYGTSQGTGYVWVGQDATAYGGGMHYNGDGAPAFATGEGSDNICFFRSDNGNRVVTAYYSYISNNWNFYGSLLPTSTNSVDLGSSALRWRNIFTQDLHLSNGIGDYTVIEGEEDLFLVNNKNGKHFKFALIEVDPEVVPPKSNSGN